MDKSQVSEADLPVGTTVVYKPRQLEKSYNIKYIGKMGNIIECHRRHSRPDIYSIEFTAGIVLLAYLSDLEPIT